MSSTVAGAPGVGIAAQCTGPDAGDAVTAQSIRVGLLSIENDLATMKGGTYTTTATVTHGGTETFNGTVSFPGTVTGSTTFTNGTSNSITTTGNIFSGGDVGLGNTEELLSITGATNATPIVVTTAAHSLPDGAQVVIASVGGNTAANGTWVAKVLSSTTFSLVGSAGSGAYTASTGTMTRRAQVTFGASRTVTRTLKSKWDSSASQTSGARYWTDAFGTVFSGWQNVQSDPTTQQMWLGWDIDIPQGAQIASATVYFNPSTGHGGVPTDLPSVTIGKVALATGADASLASATDPNSGSVLLYEVYTALTATVGSAEYVDNSRYRYFVYVGTEWGTNAQSGFRVYGATVTYAATGEDQF